MEMIQHIQAARSLLKQGKVIAYPTEAVYGLGCCPFNEAAVLRLLALKGRTVNKGLLLLIYKWQQLSDLISPISEANMQRVQATWPGHVTWVFPKSTMIPSWISGEHATVAIRMTAHPVARALCINGPIVSTSANISGALPALEIATLNKQFPHGIDGCVVGKLGDSTMPSAIYDVLTGQKLR